MIIVATRNIAGRTLSNFVSKFISTHLILPGTSSRTPELQVDDGECVDYYGYYSGSRIQKRTGTRFYGRTLNVEH